MSFLGDKYQLFYRESDTQLCGFCGLLSNNCECHLLMSKLRIPHISSLAEDPLLTLINITIYSTV